jgi:hypothetical protein
MELMTADTKLSLDVELHLFEVFCSLFYFEICIAVSETSGQGSHTYLAPKY